MVYRSGHPYIFLVGILPGTESWRFGDLVMRVLVGDLPVLDWEKYERCWNFEGSRRSYGRSASRDHGERR